MEAINDKDNPLKCGIKFPELKDPLVGALANRVYDIWKCFLAVEKLGERLEGTPKCDEITAVLRGIASCGRIAVSATVDLLPLLISSITKLHTPPED